MHVAPRLTAGVGPTASRCFGTVFVALSAPGDVYAVSTGTQPTLPSSRCAWVVSAAPGLVVSLSVARVLARAPDADGCGDALSVYDGDVAGAPALASLCNVSGLGAAVVVASTGRGLAAVFQGDGRGTGSVVAAVATALAAPCGPHSALVTVTWVGVRACNWTNASCWAPALVPRACHHAVINRTRCAELGGAQWRLGVRLLTRCVRVVAVLSYLCRTA